MALVLSALHKKSLSGGTKRQFNDLPCVYGHAN
jgi:hypothetical protein